MSSSPHGPSKITQNQLLADLLKRGLALHQAGRGIEAAPYYEGALARDPKHPAANHLLGLVRLQQGLAREAVDFISRAVAAKPAEPQYLSNLGVALNAAGRSQEAVVALQRATAQNPEFAEAFSNLGMALRALGRFDEAASAYRRAVRLKPGEAGFQYNLANALHDAGYIFVAESAYRRAIHLRPNYTAAINGLAAMLDRQGRAGEALDLVEMAIPAQPGDPQLHLRRARSLYHQNRLEDAVESFDRTIALNPSFGEAHLHRAHAVRHEPGDQSIRAMQELFRAGTAPIEDRIFAGFGLGKALTDIGEHHDAIATYTEANRMHRERTPFSLEQAVADLRGDVRRFAGISGPFANGGFREAMPIFVVGLPRSGKTTVETILSRHPTVAGAGELPIMGRLVREFLREQHGVAMADVPPDRLVELGRAYMREAQSLVPSGQVLVDTMPSNYRHVGFIRMALPHARIIRCIRTPADHRIAIYEKYLTSGGYEYANDLDELQPFHVAFLETMTAWHARFPGAIYDIDLANLANDRQGEVRKLLEFCGLAWSDACMAEAQSEPQFGEWPRERVIRNRTEHLAAWRQVRPQLWD